MQIKFISTLLISFVAALVFSSCDNQRESANASEPRLFPIKENSRWGYMDEIGKIVVAPSYDYAWDFSDSLGRFKDKGKYGFINLKGEVVIPASFSYADDFNCAYTRVNTTDTTVLNVLYDGYGIEKNWTFMNKKGVVFSETFAMAEPVKNNVAAVRDVVDYTIPYSYVTFDGGSLVRNERVTEAIFTFNGHDLAPAADPNTGKIGFVDKGEQWIVLPSFDQVDPLSEGLAPAKKNNLYGYIDVKGNWIYQQVVSVNDYYYLSSDFKPFSNGLAVVRFTKDAYGYIGKDGKPAFTQRFKSASTFTKDGYAIVSTEQGTGLIDTKGNFVIKPHLDIQSVDKGIVIYNTPEGYGAKDLKTGKDIVAPQHSDVSISGNLIRIKEAGATAGYINTKGEFVIAPQFTATWEFKNGKGIVNHKDKIVYIDKAGKILGDVPEHETPYYYHSADVIYAWSDETGKFGFSKNGIDKMVIPAAYDFATSFEGKVARVNLGAAMNEESYAYQGGKWGLIDEKGNNVLAPSYELILPFDNGIAPFNSGGQAEYVMCDGECDEMVFYTCTGGKWGLMSDEGKTVTEAQFDRMIAFGKNFLVQQGKTFGLIDRTGKQLYENKLELNFASDEGTIVKMLDANFTEAAENGKVGVIDTNGNWIVQPKFDDVTYLTSTAETPFTAGFVLAKSDGNWGAVNTSGELSVPPSYQDMRPFSNGMAAVKQNDKWGFITTSGTLVIEPKYFSVRDFQGDVAIIEEQEGSGESVINVKGETVFAADPAVTFNYEGFTEGLCIMGSAQSNEEAGYPNSTYGVINSKGSVLFNKKALSDVRIQPGGLLYVQKNNKWALATHEGTMLTGFDYDWIEPYTSQEFIRCNLGGEATYDEMSGIEEFYGGNWGLLDKTGKLRVPLKFSEIGTFSEGVAPARSGEDLDQIGYVDFSGKPVRAATK
jgi:hypothetical protein